VQAARFPSGCTLQIFLVSLVLVTPSAMRGFPFRYMRCAHDANVVSTAVCTMYSCAGLPSVARAKAFEGGRDCETGIALP
jgi:hypothetical protein